MNEYCTCPAAGFCQRHQKHKGPEQFARCKGTSGTPDCGMKYWNAWEQGKAGATAPENPVLNPPNFCDQSVVAVIEYKSSVGDVLSEVIKRETGHEIPCPECAKDIEALNAMTVDECLLSKPVYIENIYSRSYQHASPMQKVGIIADKLLHTGIAKSTIASWYDEALQKGVEPKKVQPAVVKDRKQLLRELAVRAAEARPKRQAMGTPQLKPTDDQLEAYMKTMAADKPTPKPFTGQIVWNLIYHLYPVKGVWEWHAERINDLLPKINGKAIIGIVTDNTTSTLDDVRQLIPGDNVTWIQNENIAESGDLSLRGKPFGEVSTFQQALPLLAETGDSITTYAHGKGIRQHTRDCESVRLWTEIMYETVTFAHDETVAAMASGYDFFGSFRTFGFRPFVPKHGWHYSGTFFNFRTQSAFCEGTAIEVQQVYGGVEAWPGDVCNASNAYCSFEDNAPWLRQYALEMMYPHVVNRQMQWEVDRIGTLRCEQHKRELEWFLELLKPSDSVLVIGSKHGGIENAIKQRFQSIKTVSIDINPQNDNQQFVIVGSSADTNTQRESESHGPFTVVFIDGDHSYFGVSEDWKFAKRLRPRMVAFHDIATAVKHRNEGCEVDQLWNEIKSSGLKTSEKIVGAGWGGIGVVEFE